MKIALIGYGKMGREIERIAQDRGHEIVARIDVNNQEDFESDAFRSADVAIEFTVPSVAINNYRRCFNAGVKVVSGTTGWLEHLPEIKQACDEGHTFFYASNFSLGVNVLFAVNSYLAKIMSEFPDYSVRMKEIHHIHKLDAPSGTAITLAEGVMENIPSLTSWELGTEPKAGIIPIESVREGEVPGYHEVLYDSEVDTITIAHNTKSRKGLALGAVVAAEYTASNNGFLTMKDMLNF